MGCAGCGAPGHGPIVQLEVREVQGRWHWHAVDAEGVIARVGEGWGCSAHAVSDADQLGLGVPVLIR